VRPVAGAHGARSNQISNEPRVRWPWLFAEQDALTSEPTLATTLDGLLEPVRAHSLLFFFFFLFFFLFLGFSTS